jgi:hypothetical protein
MPPVLFHSRQFPGTEKLAQFLELVFVVFWRYLGNAIVVDIWIAVFGFEFN